LTDELGNYRLVRFAEAPEVGDEAVLDFWEREGALPLGQPGPDRLAEVSFVAIDEADALAAVSTAYLRRNERLRTEMWHLRAFVAAAHRRSSLAAHLVRENRQWLEQAFVSGEDRSAPGILMEVESPELKSWRDAVWTVDWSAGKRYTFIGENEKGDHLRVHWFPGARISPSA
jgi:hypothetical protein